MNFLKTPFISITGVLGQILERENQFKEIVADHFPNVFKALNHSSKQLKELQEK